jgi:hypothetical protein
MYGLINKAIENWVTLRVGVDGWRRIQERSKIGLIRFVAFQSYPDELTYALVAATAEELNEPASQVLESVGEYWALFTVQQGYGNMLDLAGSSFFETLTQLDAMHARLALTMPELRPPSFECEQAENGRLTLRYYSEREGLTPMVVGLLRGLASRFHQTISIQHTLRRSATVDYDQFEMDLHESD